MTWLIENDAFAVRIRRELDFCPGAFCDEVGFSYSYIFEHYKDFLLNKNPIFTTIAEVTNNPKILERISYSHGKIFARPNSPLKEFSGRILDVQNLTPAHFDYGFYHYNMNLPIVLSEYKAIEKEWRFVCVADRIVTGCEYKADGRKGVAVVGNSDAWQFAQNIADIKQEYDAAYIIDVCESESKLFLVEMNPFSGADLYCCDAEGIIEAIEAAKA